VKKYLAGVFLALPLFASCASVPVEKAFSGGMASDEARKVIVDYCQTCHVHRDFKPVDHLTKVAAQYTKEPYKSAKDCRTCHSIEKNFWNDIIRSTYFPEGRLVNDQ